MALPVQQSMTNPLQQGAEPAASPQASPLPQQSSSLAQSPTAAAPPPSPALIKTAVKVNKLILSELVTIANDQSLLADPDKLQKALLGLAADAHREAGKDAPPVAASLAHVMSVMNDPLVKIMGQRRLTILINRLH